MTVTERVRSAVDNLEIAYLATIDTDFETASLIALAYMNAKKAAERLDKERTPT